MVLPGKHGVGETNPTVNGRNLPLIQIFIFRNMGFMSKLFEEDLDMFAIIFVKDIDDLSDLT